MSNLARRLGKLEAESSKDAKSVVPEDSEEDSLAWLQRVLEGPDPYEWVATASRKKVEARLAELADRGVEYCRSGHSASDVWLESASREAEEKVLRERLAALNSNGSRV